MFYFFFSSRRRHTRSKRDWSSDVCSSDLKKMDIEVLDTAKVSELIQNIESESFDQLYFLDIDIKNESKKGLEIARSEERRVGKECRCWWWREEEKKKKRKR